MLRPPIRDHAFFEQAQFQRLFGNDLFQVLGLAFEILHLIAGYGSRGIAGEAPLSPPLGSRTSAPIPRSISSALRGSIGFTSTPSDGATA